MNQVLNLTRPSQELMSVVKAAKESGRVPIHLSQWNFHSALESHANKTAVVLFMPLDGVDFSDSVYMAVAEMAALCKRYSKVVFAYACSVKFETFLRQLGVDSKVIR